MRGMNGTNIFRYLIKNYGRISMFNIFKKAPARIKVRIERGDQPYFPEEIVQSVITIQAEKTFLVDKLSAALIVEETFVTEDSDGDTTTNVAYKDVVDEQILIHDSEIPEGRQRGFTVSFRIPENAVRFSIWVLSPSLCVRVDVASR